MPKQLAAFMQLMQAVSEHCSSWPQSKDDSNDESAQDVNLTAIFEVRLYKITVWCGGRGLNPSDYPLTR